MAAECRGGAISEAHGIATMLPSRTADCRLGLAGFMRDSELSFRLVLATV